MRGSRVQRAAAATLLVFALSGCPLNADEAGQAWTKPVTFLVAQPKDTPGNIVFPPTELGSSAEIEVSIRNGGALAGLAQFRLEGDNADQFDLTLTAIQLEVHTSAVVGVRYRPTWPGMHLAKLVCTLGEARLDVPITGSAVTPAPPGPHLRVGPSSLELRYDTLGSNPAQLDCGIKGADADKDDCKQRVRRFTLANVGSEALRLGRLTAEGWVDSPPEIIGPTDVIKATLSEFSPERDAETPPPTIAPQSATPLVIQLQKYVDADLVVRIRSDDPEHPVLDLPVRVRQVHYDCSAVVVPPVMTFAESGLQAFTVRSANPRAPPCVVRARLASGVDAFAVTGSNDPRIMREDGALDVEVAFDLDAPPALAPPLARGSVLVTLQDDAGTTSRLVELYGESDRRCLTVDGDRAFGAIPVGCGPITRRMAIGNRCSAPRRVTDIWIEDTRGTVSNDYRLSEAPPLPVALEPNAPPLEIGVRFQPMGDGLTFAVLNVGSHGMAKELDLSGQATPNPVITDEFEQCKPQKVDVLLVVDDTVSMADKRDRLGRFLDRALAHMAAEPNVDYHFAVTTTSADVDAGNFLPFDGSRARVVSLSAPGGVAAARANAMAAGASSTAAEMLVLPAYLALSPPLPMSGVNSGFLRPDAMLLEVLIISDAADHDETNSPGWYLLHLRALQPAGAVRVSGIVPTLAAAPSGCGYSEPSAGTDTAVRDLASLSGGTLAEVCDADWPEAIVAGHGCVARSSFELSATPQAENLLVIVDGVVYGANDARWEYDASANAIVFEPADIPAPGAKIAIKYHAACP